MEIANTNNTQAFGPISMKKKMEKTIELFGRKTTMLS